jgi:hypothetical protein
MSSHHVVQFYGADTNALITRLGRYVAEGVDAGESVVVISNRDLHDALFRALARHAGEPDFREDGRLLVLEAEQVMERLYENGILSASRFDEVVGGLMRTVAARSRSHRVRAYGDMVDVLWRKGRRADAVELERYWNDLQAQLPFDLYCAYSIDAFSDEFQAEAIAPVLAQHTAIVRADAPRLNGALDFAAYEKLGRTCPPLADAEAAILWLRENAPEHAPEILERAKRYVDD